VYMGLDTNIRSSTRVPLVGCNIICENPVRSITDKTVGYCLKKPGKVANANALQLDGHPTLR